MFSFRFPICSSLNPQNPRVNNHPPNIRQNNCFILKTTNHGSRVTNYDPKFQADQRLAATAGGNELRITIHESRYVVARIVYTNIFPVAAGPCRFVHLMCRKEQTDRIPHDTHSDQKEKSRCDEYKDRRQCNDQPAKAQQCDSRSKHTAGNTLSSL